MRLNFIFAHVSDKCFFVDGGEGGIRTHGTLTRTTVFETAPFDHSGTSPIQCDVSRDALAVESSLLPYLLECVDELFHATVVVVWIGG